MILVSLIGFCISISHITTIRVDGVSIPDFVPTNFEYVIPIPFEKNITRLSVDTDVPMPVNLYQDGAQQPFGARLRLPYNENVFELTTGDSITYKVVFKKVPWSTEKISVDTTKRLTPRLDEIQTPKINCPKIYGARPESPFYFYIATTGERPITFSATDLPSSLKLDSQKGIITGITPSEGTYAVSIVATNSLGSDKITFVIKSGETIQLTPPIGWSSWYAQSEAISEDGVKKMADSVIKHGLNNVAFSYLNIDDSWQGLRNPNPPYQLLAKKNFSIDGTKYGGFNDMKGLSKYLNDNGLRLGIYSGPKLSTYQGFIGSSSNNISGVDSNAYSPNNKNPGSRGPVFDENGDGHGKSGNPGVFQPSQMYGRCWGGYDDSIGGQFGDFWMGTADTQQFADWDIDYIKWDWYLLKDPEFTNKLTQQIFSDVLKTKRNMVVSLSNSIGSSDLLTRVFQNGANVVRISGDITDNWNSMSNEALITLNYLDLAGKGKWLDPDMLQLGMIGVPGGLNVNFHKSHLSNDEQYFQVSFWAITPAPLIVSSELTLLDDFTLGLLQNREVNLINQDSLGLSAKKVANSNEILAKVLDDGSVAVGVFNWNNWFGKTISVEFEEIKKVTGIDFSKGATVRNVWEQKNEGNFVNVFKIYLTSRQGLLFRLIPIE